MRSVTAKLITYQKRYSFENRGFGPLPRFLAFTGI
jgi:hypothetical protein